MMIRFRYVRTTLLVMCMVRRILVSSSCEILAWATAIRRGTTVCTGVGEDEIAQMAFKALACWIDTRHGWWCQSEELGSDGGSDRRR
jgi:hypothetical protein